MVNYTGISSKEALIRNWGLLTILAIAVTTCWAVLIKQVNDPSIIQINRNEVEIEKPMIDSGLVDRINKALDSPENYNGGKHDSLIIPKVKIDPSRLNSGK